MGGTIAPWLFGWLIDTGSRRDLFYGDLLAAGLLLATVVVVCVLRRQGRAGVAGGGRPAALGGRRRPRRRPDPALGPAARGAIIAGMAFASISSSPLHR